ncbi:hypothetical protein H6P81_018039 [Aristolochia fimbriata]|uniref:SWIM-type domain-containing protein n=1 Tax=Aristolochia fimbriata TaxID=158543 RepID=A0AAV7DZV2_ARIFI|nr:hypothetical protein H6P81_018039 [Aristolochia fimbriata]
MMYNVLGGNPCTDHISIWLSFTCNGRLMYTPVLDDVSLESGLGQVKYGFQSMLELFVKRDTYSYEMGSRRSLENVGGTGEGAVKVYGGQALAEGDERVERERSEEANDDSSSEGSWPEPVTEDEVEEEEDVELPLLTMGVPPLEENDEPYPDPWIGVMDMDVAYKNTMVPGVDDDNVPPPIGVGVGQRFMTKDALVRYLKDYCISRHVQFRVHKSGPTVYSVRCTGDQCPWHVRTSFTLSPYEIIQLVKDKYHIQVSYSRAWRARNKALVAVFGGWDESYNLLPQFFKAIKDTNRRTKYKMITTDDAIHGFQFCRPFISVDGTHLYGKYKGCLLIATSFDGDNRLFPLAFALVEKENIDTWTWFISCLARQVVRGRSPMCIISDRHSGIIRAVRDVFPRPHRHRFCIRHIIANLKKRYSVKDLNKMVWRCVRAETVAQYDHEMQILEEPLASAIFYRMNAWFVHMREKAAQVTGDLCPSVDAHLRSVVDDARHVHVVAYGDGIFQAGEHRVNVMLRECTCRSFQIYQVPCVHVIAVCGAINYDLHQMTSEYYYASTNAQVYERAFDVPTRRSTWVQEGPVVLPPGLKRTLGRPMSTRIHNSMDWRDDDRGRYLCGNCRDGRRPFIVRSGIPQERGHLAWGGFKYTLTIPTHFQDPGCLECTEHFQTLPHWPMDEGMLPYVEAAGFGALHRVQWLRLDKPLITALVERWRSETNTFHLANGEMTIKLEDVGILLVLRVDGDAVTGSTRGDWMELARCPRSSHDIPDTVRGFGGRREVQLGSSHISLPLPGTREGVSHGSRWYCWMPHPYAVVGGGNVYIFGRPTLLEEPELCGGPLGSRYVERPDGRMPPTPVEPGGAVQTSWTTSRAIVNLQPYQDFMQRLPAICVEGRRIWLSRTPLICFEIVELYVPDRVMLQFGLEQVTPPEDVEHVPRISRKGRAGEDWALYLRDYIARWEAREDSVVMGSRAHTPRHAPSDYMRWYLGATR